ncbi:MAG TPA: hypothetical protein VGL75_08845 [Acidothermaceae bacterium]
MKIDPNPGMFWDITRSAGSNSNLAAFLAGFALTAMAIVLVRFDKYPYGADILKRPADVKRGFLRRRPATVENAKDEQDSLYESRRAQFATKATRLLLMAFISLIIASIEWGVLSAQPPLPTDGSIATACFVSGACAFTSAADSILATACVDLTAVGALALIAAMAELVSFNFNEKSTIRRTVRRSFFAVSALAVYEISAFVWQAISDLGRTITPSSVKYPTSFSPNWIAFAPMVCATIACVAVTLGAKRDWGKRLATKRTEVKKPPLGESVGYPVRWLFRWVNVATLVGTASALAVATSGLIPFRNYGDKLVSTGITSGNVQLRLAAATSCACSVVTLGVLLVCGWGIGRVE